MGYTKLGTLGVSVGAALFMGMIIVCSNVVGIWTGEWKGVSALAKKKLYTGLFVFVLAMIVISVGNALQEKKLKGNQTPDVAIKKMETGGNKPSGIPNPSDQDEKQLKRQDSRS